MAVANPTTYILPGIPRPAMSAARSAMGLVMPPHTEVTLPGVSRESVVPGDVTTYSADEVVKMLGRELPEGYPINRVNSFYRSRLHCRMNKWKRDEAAFMWLVEGLSCFAIGAVPLVGGIIEQDYPLVTIGGIISVPSLTAATVGIVTYVLGKDRTNKQFPYYTLFQRGTWSHGKMWKSFVSRMLFKDRSVEEARRRKSILDEYGLYPRQFRNERRPLTNNQVPLTGVEVGNIVKKMSGNVDAYAARLLWTLRAMDGPLNLSRIRPALAGDYFAAFDRAMNGETVEQPVPRIFPSAQASLIRRSAAYVSHDANPVPAAALAAFLGGYYAAEGRSAQARHMVRAAKYYLQGKLGDSFREHVAVVGERPPETECPGEAVTRGIHYLAMTQMLKRKIMYAIAARYAGEAARIFGKFGDGSSDVAKLHRYADSLAEVTSE